jgi:hypothetical protein
MSKNIPLIYLPTKESCEAYGVPRIPTKIGNGFPINGDEIHSNENGTFDFINGQQFQKSSTPRRKGRMTTTKNSIKNPADEYEKDNRWIFDILKDRRDDSFSKDETNGENFKFTNSNLKIASNEIIVEVLTNRPYTITPEYGQDGLYRAVYKSGQIDSSGTNYNAKSFDGPDETVAVFRILPEGDEFLKFNHEHDWGEPDGILKKVISAGVEAGKKLSRGATTIDRSTGNFIPEQQYNIDINNKYQSSRKPSLKFKFVLFTKNNFINDIFLPIMTLCYYSSPSRTPDVGENVRRFLNDLMVSQKEAAKDNNELLREIQQTEQDLRRQNSDINAINSLTPGVRFLVTDPPPFFRVWHSSGLFFYPRMSLNEVKYSFKKPFYNFTGIGASNDYPQEGQTNPGFFCEILKNNKVFEEYSFPISAEVELSFEGIDPLFFDDFASLMTNLNADSGQNIIDIGVRNNNRFLGDNEDLR